MEMTIGNKDIVTVREAGADGVMEAIRDGMKAAEYSRAIEAITRERDSLLDRNRKMAHDILKKDEEIGRLGKQCREYRFSRSRAYRDVLDGQVSQRGEWLVRLVSFLFGSVFTFIVVTIIIWGSRI